MNFVLFHLGIGFIVAVHDNRELPVISNKAINVGGGRIYRVGYSKKIHYSLGSPYTSCTHDAPPMLRAVFNKTSHIDYAHGEYMCSTVCYQVKM